MRRESIEWISYAYSINTDWSDIALSIEQTQYYSNPHQALKTMYNELTSDGLFILVCNTIHVSSFDFINLFGIVPNYNAPKEWCPCEGKYFKFGELCYKRGMKDLMFWGIKK